MAIDRNKKTSFYHTFTKESYLLPLVTYSWFCYCVLRRKIFFFKMWFIDLESVCACARVGGGADKDGERIPSWLCTECRARQTTCVWGLGWEERWSRNLSPVTKATVKLDSWTHRRAWGGPSHPPHACAHAHHYVAALCLLISFSAMRRNSPQKELPDIEALATHL